MKCVFKCPASLTPGDAGNDVVVVIMHIRWWGTKIVLGGDVNVHDHYKCIMVGPETHMITSIAIILVVVLL